MSSLLAAPQGVQRPGFSHVPDYGSSAGPEAVELARMAGLVLDPWQELVLAKSLGERPDGKWAAFEVGLVVPRQNGKGAILEARELAGLFLLGERLLIHSAHQFDTSLEAFRRLLTLIESTPDLDRRVKRVSNAHGKEGIELLNGQRIRFRARTKGGGRGFTSDCLIYDEAMDLPKFAQSATLPTLSARPNPQVWYAGSAVDQNVHEHGVVFSRIRERGMTGDDPSLAYFEWSVPEPLTDVDERVATDPWSWAIANPGLGIRISTEHVESEQRSMDHRGFAAERLGAGDWPATSDLGVQVIDPQEWAALIDLDSQLEDPVSFAFDVTPSRSHAAIGVAGKRSDGLFHVEVVDHRKGVGWVADRLAELVERHAPNGVVCDTGGPAGSLLTELEDLGVEVEPVNAKEYAQGCGLFFDVADQGKLRHGGTRELAAALQGAKQRSLGDAWAWSRKSSSVDISPLVACTLALHRSSKPAVRGKAAVFV